MARLSKQLGARDLRECGAREQTRTEHLREVTAFLGWRPAGDREFAELDEFLLARAMEHDSPTLVFRLACEQLRSSRVIRPGPDVLSRRVGAARERAVRGPGGPPRGSGSVRVLARRAFVSPQTMNDIVVGLERLGLVDRKPHPTHGRVLQANLTRAGLRLVTEAHGQVLAIEAEMIGDLSTEERSILFALLGRCADRLEDTARSGDEQADGARTTAGTSGGRRRRSAS